MEHTTPPPAPKKTLRSAIAKLQAFFGAKKTKQESAVVERYKEQFVEKQSDEQIVADALNGSAPSITPAANIPPVAIPDTNQLAVIPKPTTDASQTEELQHDPTQATTTAAKTHRTHHHARSTHVVVHVKKKTVKKHKTSKTVTDTPPVLVANSSVEGQESTPMEILANMEQEEASAPRAAGGALLASFPHQHELLNADPITVSLDKREHIVAFRAEEWILDGVNYTISQHGSPLDITSVQTDAHAIRLTCASSDTAAGKSITLTLTEDELQTTLTTLLKRGTHTVRAGNRAFTITRF